MAAEGFEEKVELALKERDEQLQGIVARQEMGMGSVRPNQSQSEAVAAMSTGDKVESVADHLVGQIVDAVSGTSAIDEKSTPAPPQAAIEAAAEKVVAQEIATEEIDQGSPGTTAPIESPPSDLPPSPTSSLAAAAASTPLSSRWTSPASRLAWYEDWLRGLFSDEHHVVLTQRELSTVAMEGVAGGMAVMGMLVLLLRPR